MLSTTTTEMIPGLKSGKNTAPSLADTENSVHCMGKKGVAGPLQEHLEYFAEIAVCF